MIQPVLKGALKGVRIADFGWVLAGPYSTMLLSYLGAEVIKIETRKRPDEQRIARRGGDTQDLESSTNFLECNLGKLSVTLNLSTEKGLALAKRVVSVSDVVMENMRPGVMDKLGVGYKDLVKVKEDIIMLSVSGYGATGPYRSYTAYAPCFASFGGLAHLTGYPDDLPNTMTSSCDTRAGTAAAFAIVMALNIRRKTGQGQYIDLSSSEYLAAMIGDQLMDYAMNGRSPTRMGNHDAIMAPHNCYRCKGEDKWISIAVATDLEWESLCKAMGNPEWTHEATFADAYSRWQNQDRLDSLLQDWTQNYDAYELMKLLQGGGVAAMPSVNASELFSDPHNVARENIVEVQHPVIGKKMVIAPPWKMSETPATIQRTAPLLGEHNDYVLGDLLGLSEDEIAQLMEEKVVY
jgi:crotonobetainyl-CoA:carnitine CoA-transferase CaiB-like acyl-CoA transferase